MDESIAGFQKVIDQISDTVIWLVEQIAKQNGETMRACCQRLQLAAPKEYMGLFLKSAEESFRMQGN